MFKFLLKFFSVILIVIISIIIFLSYFGLETNKFDSLIKNKANEVNKNVKLDFYKTKIHLNLKELNLVLKLQNPKVLIKKNEINLSKLDLFLSIKSFISSDFLLKRAEVAFIKNDIKDLTKITRIFLPNIINKQLDKIFEKGKLEGEVIIPFKKDGSLDQNYGFLGKISNASIYLNKDFKVKNLTIEIKSGKEVKNNGFVATVNKGSLFDIDLTGSQINLLREEDGVKIESILKTRGKVNFSEIKKISYLLNFKTDSLKNINGTADLKTDINFDINKKFRIKNLSLLTEGKVDYLEIDTIEKKIIKKYLPLYDPKIILKDTKIKFEKTKSHRITKLEGSINVNNNFDNFKLNEKFNYAKKIFDINGNIDLTNSEINIERLNYNKKSGKKSNLIFDVSFVLNKLYNIKSLNFEADRTKIDLSNIKLNNNLEAIELHEIKVKTFSSGIKNNDFSLVNSGKIIISGELYDAEPLLKSLYKKDDKKTFGKKFNNEIKVNFKKTLTGTNDTISNFSMIASIKKGSYEKLSLKGNFSPTEIIEMSIYQIDKDIKTLQIISDRARPFIKNFNFIKGFEGGKLEYESIISTSESDSNLTITNFKISKVPALAQLLTLASLQGIADTLSGDGIRFKSFEMKTKTEGNVININEALALGPAVSILLEGYVDKGKIVSLRGTLVPATKLNSIIANIPLVGDILVGKKSGEGVVGVSFKMKGPPKNIKTTVNPIKTLTPRFIVRAVEKMKKKKKEETK